MKTIAIAAVAALLLAGCNTVAGVGKDMSAVGHAVTKTANDASRGNPSRSAACVQDSRVPPRTCPPARTSYAAKSSGKQSAKATVKPAQTKQTETAETQPVKTDVKATAKTKKSGWWQ